MAENNVLILILLLSYLTEYSSDVIIKKGVIIDENGNPQRHYES